MNRQKATQYRHIGSGDAIPTASHIEFATPSRQPSFESDVVVPVAQTFAIAVVAGVAAAATTWAMELGDAVRIRVAAGGLTFAVALMWRLLSIHETLWKIESHVGFDLDGDGEVGEPEPHVIVNGARTAADRRAQQENRFRAEYARFIRGCATNTSLRRWEPTLGRDRYSQWRDCLIVAGWAQWLDEDNKRQGWELVTDPEEIIGNVL